MSKIKVKFKVLLQETYQSLYDDNLIDEGTLYFVEDTKKLYRGSKLYVNDWAGNSDIDENVFEDGIKTQDEFETIGHRGININTLRHYHKKLEEEYGLPSVFSFSVGDIVYQNSLEEIEICHRNEWSSDLGTIVGILMGYDNDKITVMNIGFINVWFDDGSESMKSNVSWSPEERDNSLVTNLGMVTEQNGLISDVDGEGNTEKICAYYGEGYSYAAKTCKNYNRLNYNWYLPSTGELFAYYLKKEEIDSSLALFGMYINDKQIYTSTQKNEYTCWVLSRNYGYDTELKSNKVNTGVIPFTKIEYKGNNKVNITNVNIGDGLLWIGGKICVSDKYATIDYVDAKLRWNDNLPD